MFNADFENGSESSGYAVTGSKRMEIPGYRDTNGNLVNPGLASAEDASYIVSGGAHGSAFALANKVVLDDPAYIGGGFPRSESGTSRMDETLYRVGDHMVYTFSLLLKDLVPSVKGTRSGPSEDVLWQFKRSGAGHDFHIGLWGDKLRLGWSGNEQKLVVVDNMMPYVN